MGRRNAILLVSVAVAVAGLTGCGGDDAAVETGSSFTSDTRTDPTTTNEGGEAAPTAVEGVDGVALMVSGTVDLSSRTIELGPTRSLPTTRSLTPDPGPFLLEAEAPDGTKLAEVPFDIITQSDSDPPSARFSLALQPQPTSPIGQLRFSYLGDEVAVITGSASIPTVALVAPSAASGPVPVDDITIEWEADDADGDVLSFAVYFSADDGVSWTTVVTRADGRRLIPVPGILEPSSRARLLVTASDGVNASYDISGPIELVSG